MLNNILFHLADLTLDELRRMYFSLKDKVLHSIGIPHSDTEALETILKDKVKETKLGSRTHPKYVTCFVLMAFFKSLYCLYHGQFQGVEVTENGKATHLYTAVILMQIY